MGGRGIEGLVGRQANHRWGKGLERWTTQGQGLTGGRGVGGAEGGEESTLLKAGWGRGRDSLMGTGPEALTRRTSLLQGGVETGEKMAC